MVGSSASPTRLARVMASSTEKFGIAAGVVGIMFGLAEWVRRGVRVCVSFDYAEACSLFEDSDHDVEERATS